jgi:hypothetical protein
MSTEEKCVGFMLTDIKDDGHGGLDASGLWYE